MRSSSNQEAILDKQDTSQLNKFQAVELTLTHDQYAIIQHYLPKGYSLLEKKLGKREKGFGHKYPDNENISRFSGGFENTEDDQGRSKRNRIKKVDRFLEDETPRTAKRTTSQKLTLDDDLSQCARILNQLKKNRNAYPFLDPVDPEKSGASNYRQIIKDPMDFSKVQRNLKLGEYQTAIQFHADITKIWSNSYSYNDKTSEIYKMTVEMEKLYKKLIEESRRKKNPKQKNAKSKKAPQQFRENGKIEEMRQSDRKSEMPFEKSMNESSQNQDLAF